MGSFCRVSLLLIWTHVFVLCLAQSGDWVGGDGIGNNQRQTTYACQHSTLELSCPEHHVIRISRAMYGRFSRRLCNPHGATNLNLICHLPTAVNVISSNCDGHRQCQVGVNSSNFQDPCPGTIKYVEVQHYCEPAKSDGKTNDTGLKPLPLPDGEVNQPLLSTVPVPENLQVCMHPMARDWVYDLAWDMPESHHTILHFDVLYRVRGETGSKEVVQATPLGGHRYMYAFEPEENMRSFPHEFTVKAFALDIGWGEYSQFVSARHCYFDKDGNAVAIDAIQTTTTTTTTAGPIDGGGLRQMCGPVTKLDVFWPETEPGEVRTSTCPPFLGGKGVMHYKCLSNGQWDRNGPETDHCFEITTYTTTTTSTTTTTTTTPTKKKDVRKLVSFNNEVTSRLTKLSGAKTDQYDLSAVLPAVTKNWTQLIEKTRDLKKKKALADDFKETMLALSDELLKDDGAWNNMSVKQQRSAAASILDSVERSGLLAASTMAVGASNVTRKDNVVMKVMNVDAGQGQPAIMGDWAVTGSRDKGNRFTIPAGVLNQVAGLRKASVPIVFVVMSDISEWLTPEAMPAATPPVNDNVIDARPQQELPRRLVNSDVVSVSMTSKGRLTNLAEPVVFLLEHRQTESVENAQCAYWDTEMGGWSTEGCEVVNSSKSHTTCKCNHLTSFAVLMDITGTTQELPASARFSLELITYIGCTISILCLLLSWVTFTCFKNLDCDRNTIHKHLVFCLMVAQIVLVTGIQRTQPPVLCSIIAGVLHFFFLASFAWMCLEGVQLYVMLIEVFESEHSRVLYYYLFGYGVPSIIVAVSAAVFSEGYGTEFHCWLTIERGFIWSFVGPVLAVLLVNMVMLGIAISIMVRHSTISHTMRQKSVPQKMSVSGSVCSVEAQQESWSFRPDIPTWLKGAVVLVVLLGLTWVFGVLYLDNVYHTLIFSYIFTILNSLQGLFIFLFHCLFNEKVQKEYRRMIRQGSWCPTCLRVRYGYTSSSASRENSSSGNVMARLFRGKRRHSGCGDSSSNSAKPFLDKKRYLSSSNPSSSDGVASSRLSSDTSNNNNRKLSQQSAAPYACDSRFLQPVEMSAIAGELSEVLDGSIVDSDFVSEYCQERLRVSSEKKRYSTSSEDSGGGEEIEDEEDVQVSLDHLAALSVESLSKRQSRYTFNSELGEGDRKSEGGGGESESGVEEEEGAGVPATAPFGKPACIEDGDQNREEEEEEEEQDRVAAEININGGGSVIAPETQPLVMRQSESERVLIHNAANKPRDKDPDRMSTPRKQSPSLSHIPESGTQQESKAASTQPAHTSVPCLKFKPGHTTAAPLLLLPPRTAVIDTDKNGAAVNSLPDLSHTHPNGTAITIQIDPYGDSSDKRRSYDERAQFSPFRFSGSDC